MDLREIVEEILSKVRMGVLDEQGAACDLKHFADHEILPILGEAFRSEQDAEVRDFIICIVGERRVAAAMPLLAKALYDESPWVWKRALDGLVSLDQPECVQAIEAAQNRPFGREKDSKYFQEWLDEAIQQLREGVYGEKKAPYPAPDIAED